MKQFLVVLGLFVTCSVAVPAQSPEPPIANTRLSVNTLVREDIFAGFLRNDVVRLAHAEKNLELLLASRPGDRPALLAWQGSAALTRAAWANEASQPEQFRQHHGRALDLFAEAMSLGPDSVAVFAITGGSQVSLADRLPAAERAAGWEQAYHAYQQLWRLQGPAIEQLPVHHKGEVLSGLTQSAQRTGRDEEVAAQLDRILALLPDTPYADRARQWKDDPSARTETKLTCQTCHTPGTLAASLEEIAP